MSVRNDSNSANRQDVYANFLHFYADTCVDEGWRREVSPVFGMMC